MARDAQGNDLGAIDVQLTGFAAINFNATTAPTLAELAGNTIPTGYEYLGLFLEDGGYAEESEAGDLTYFFQQGYSLRTGEQSITGKLVPAEDNDTVWKLTGIDSNVRKDIAYDGSFGLIIATQFKNGNIVARGGMAHVTEVAPSAESRGEINSIEITFEWEYSTEYEGYYRITRTIKKGLQELVATRGATLVNSTTSSLPATTGTDKPRCYTKDFIPAKVGNTVIFTAHISPSVEASLYFFALAADTEYLSTFGNVNVTPDSDGVVSVSAVITEEGTSYIRPVIQNNNTADFTASITSVVVVSG